MKLTQMRLDLNSRISQLDKYMNFIIAFYLCVTYPIAVFYLLIAFQKLLDDSHIGNLLGMYSISFTSFIAYIIYALDRNRRRDKKNDQKDRLSGLMYNVEIYCSRLLGIQFFAVDKNNLDFIDASIERNRRHIDNYLDSISQISSYFEEETEDKILVVVSIVNSFLSYYIEWYKKICFDYNENNVKSEKELKELTDRRRREFAHHVMQFSIARKEIDVKLGIKSESIKNIIKKHIRHDFETIEPSYYGYRPESSYSKYKFSK
jgi:hypothetical protein